MWKPDDIKEKLKEVFDPELGINIVDLGLVYDVQVSEQNVNVKMTLTSPMCPIGPQIIASVHAKIKQLPLVQEIKVDLVWTPAWDPRAMANEDARIQMGLE